MFLYLDKVVAWGKIPPPPGYYYPILRTVTNLIFIISFVPTGDSFFTADHGAYIQTQNVTPFSFERRLKHGRGECEKWLDDII